MSEMRRTARALVQSRSERFESLHGAEESKARLAGSLERARMTGRTVFTPSWEQQGAVAVLVAHFDPPAGTLRVLKVLSVGMALLVGASAWAVAAHEGPLRFLLPLFTVLAILAMPFVALGLGSQREAEEARILKAIRVALRDEEQRPAPQQRWEDED